MRIRYRFVRFGANFATKIGQRSSADGDALELYENEIAVDVGGVCWGFAGESKRVIDHHFPRAHQFPAATAAVLHCTSRIRDAVVPYEGHPEGIWLVTHKEPDFDAFCSLYAAREII